MRAFIEQGIYILCHLLPWSPGLSTITAAYEGHTVRILAVCTFVVIYGIAADHHDQNFTGFPVHGHCRITESTIHCRRHTSTLNEDEFIIPILPVARRHPRMNIHLSETDIHAAWAIVRQSHDTAVWQLAESRNTIWYSIRSHSLEKYARLRITCSLAREQQAQTQHWQYSKYYRYNLHIRPSRISCFYTSVS